MALITKNIVDLSEVKKTDYSFNIREIDYLIRKFNELSFNSKDIEMAYSIKIKLQNVFKELSEMEINIIKK